jgi:hypothetical protein
MVAVMSRWVTLLTLDVDVRGEFYQTKGGDWMVRFPYPLGMHFVTRVPEPYQASNDYSFAERDHPPVLGRSTLPGAYICSGGDL